MTNTDPFLAALANVPALPGNRPSSLRLRIRATFDGITAARKRGVTWAQITALMIEAGVTSHDGTPPTAKECCALYHTERRERGGRRRRKEKPPAVVTTEGSDDLRY